MGAAGFTLGDFDDHNDYLFVDVDPALQKAAEDHLLLHKLGANKKFAVIDARAYVHQAAERGELYDMIVLDTFKAGFAMPEHLLTREYFQDVKAALKPGGFMIMNSIASAHFEDDYTRRMDNTLRSVFPHLTRTVMPGSGEEFNGWEKQGSGAVCISAMSYISTAMIPREIRIWQSIPMTKIPISWISKKCNLAFTKAFCRIIQ